MQNRTNIAFERYMQSLTESSNYAEYSKRQREAAQLLASEWLYFAVNNGTFDND